MSKKCLILLLLIILITGCSKYKRYSTAEKITLISETTSTSSETSDAETTFFTETTVSSQNVSEEIIIASDCQEVYYTKNGKRYHCINPCGRGTYYECSLEEAIEKGLTPCGKCIN